MDKNLINFFINFINSNNVEYLYEQLLCHLKAEDIKIDFYINNKI